MKAYEEAVGRSKKMDTKEEKPGKEVKEKEKDKERIESRLDFLARMYETKKGKQDVEEPAVPSAEQETDEEPGDESGNT